MLVKNKTVNENFFAEWNKDMAYVLGFVVADGCVMKRKNRKNSYIFNITSKDIDHLKNIKKVMGCDDDIKLKSSRSFDKNKKCGFFNICNKKVCRDLINLGIYPRKTYNLGIIKVPNKYFRDFLRGFFDGDGTVYIYKVNSVLQLKMGFICASKEFLENLNERICEAINIPFKEIHTYKDVGRIPKYNIYYYINDSEKLYDFMYGNNPQLYLKRKKDVFDKWKTIERRHYKKENYPSKIGWHLNKNLSKT